MHRSRIFNRPNAHSAANKNYGAKYTKNMYEGHSINGLQNGAIPFILKLGKIRNIRFVANFERT